jgi:hypothetical protein
MYLSKSSSSFEGKEFYADKLEFRRQSLSQNLFEKLSATKPNFLQRTSPLSLPNLSGPTEGSADNENHTLLLKLFLCGFCLIS